MAFGPWGNEVSASSTFTGGWVTDPDHPETSVCMLRYGGVGRQNAKDRAKTAMQFVGRKYPVYDVGDARAESVSIDTILSSEDGDADEQLATLSEMIGEGEVVLFRDGRGRKMYAVGTDFQVEDLEMGSYHITFLLNRVDFDEALPEPEPEAPVNTDTQPKNVVITPDNYSGMALIDWDPVDNAQIYHIYVNGIEVGTTSEDATTYGPLDTNQYTVQVTATVGGVESNKSDVVAFNIQRPTSGGGGTTTPTTTVPQNFRAFPTAQNSVSFQWDPVPGATSYQVFEARSPSGVTDGITTLTTMSRGVSKPLGDGPFDYWVKALVNGVQSAESNHQQFTLPYDGGPITGGGGGGGGGGTGGALPAPPVVLGLKNGDAGYLHYNLGCGFTDSKGHKDYDPQTLEDWSTATANELAANYYTVIDAAGKYCVAMTVEPAATRTSPNTSYPRCEHREMDQTSTGNNNKAVWVIDTNDHDFSGFSRIMTLPPAKPGVCINQLHDQDDDTVMIRTEAISGKVALVLNVYGTRMTILNSDYKLGLEIYSRIRINNKTLTIYYSISSSTTTSAAVQTSVTYTYGSAMTNSNPPWYHKFGCYAQSNQTTDTSGTKCLVYVRDWKQWHTGWPTPVTGNYAGPGGTGGTGTPIVSAGADATVSPGATFSRTAQITGSGITAQGWRIVGAGGSTTDQSTAAGKNNWGAPLAQSDEFNYTGAPDTTKWNVYNGTGHGGNGVRSPQRISVSNGIMTITGLAGAGNTGGMESKLQRQYGKTEIRMRSYYSADPTAPGDKDGGYHPVGILWSDAVPYPGNGELDFIENGEPGMQAADAFLHYPSLNGTNYQIDVPDTPVDMRNFHNFAIEWNSTGVKLYVDGVLWYSAAGGAVAGQRKNIQDMDATTHLTLQLDAFQASGNIGSVMEVEWVRFYPVTPVSSNAQLSTGPALSYTAPTTPGTYTLEYFATNPSGTSTDQMTLTVGTATGGGGEGGTTDPGTTQTLGIGGIPAPAAAANVTKYSASSLPPSGGLKITTGGRIYDGGGQKVSSINIAADNVTVQNFDVQGGTAPGIYSMGTGNVIQNNKITQMSAPSDGDINGITFFGNGTKILYNEIGTDSSNLVKGSAGASHTDGIQTWNTSSKRSSSDVLIKGNRIVGPGSSDSARLHQGIMAEGKDTTDGGGGGTGVSQNWTVEDNFFRVNGGTQTLKFDDIDNVTIRRNTFAGSTTKIVAKGSLSTGINYVSSGADANIVTGSYSSTVGS